MNYLPPGSDDVVDVVGNVETGVGLTSMLVETGSLELVEGGVVSEGGVVIDETDEVATISSAVELGVGVGEGDTVVSGCGGGIRRKMLPFP